MYKNFFAAVISNNLERVSEYFKDKNFNLNCTDQYGNTALHIAANRNQCELAILLIEKGISSVLKNNNQLTALDLAKSKQMREIIGFAPHNLLKYEGFLYKKRKFFGYKEYYVVLNRGYLNYYLNK